MNPKRLLKPAPIECEEDLYKLRYPLILMPKYDGIRCFLANGRTYTNTMKEIPNDYIRNWLNDYTKNGYANCMWDGELLLRNTKDYNAVQSAVMSKDGEPDFYYCVFDCDLAGGKWFKAGGYSRRIAWVENQKFTDGKVVPANRYNVRDAKEVLDMEGLLLTFGFEGIILRDPEGKYKAGRSTFKEQICLKFKRTEDAEAEILELIEAEHNLNEATVDCRGLSKRTSHKDNKLGAGRLGSFKVRGINGRYKDKIFYVSPGCLDHDKCHWMWLEALDFIGDILTYKYDKTRGTDDAPSSARFKAFRKEME
jgi:DNA ligase-1